MELNSDIVAHNRAPADSFRKNSSIDLLETLKHCVCSGSAELLGLYQRKEVKMREADPDCFPRMGLFHVMAVLFTYQGQSDLTTMPRVS